MTVLPSSMSHGVSSRPPRHRPRLRVFVIALIVCWSCSGNTTDVAENTDGREVFMGAYVDLRVATVSSGTTVLGSARDSILAVYGVTGEDLLEFVDIRGEDVEFMRDLWAEIEGRLLEQLEQNAQEEDEELEED